MITTLVGSTAFYVSLRRWLRLRQAWRWWHQYQTNRFHVQAESIRDDLLQQTFAFRRFLETSLVDQPNRRQTEQWLNRFQILYQSLEQLSDRLSPPFVGDSLPLALRFMVQAWQRSHPGIVVQLSLPNDWPERETVHNPVILSIFTGLLETLFAESDRNYGLHIALDYQPGQCVLTFEQTRPPSGAPVNTHEIEHLKEIFRSLTAGRLEVTSQPSGWRGHLCWKEP